MSPPKSEKQRKLMAGICHGDIKKKGISKETACEILHGDKKNSSGKHKQSKRK